MIPADTATHTIRPTTERPRYPGMEPTYGATCDCGVWRLAGLTQEKRDEQVSKHRMYTGAEVVR